MNERKELLSVHWCRKPPMVYFGSIIDWNRTLSLKFKSIIHLFEAHDNLTVHEHRTYKNSLINFAHSDYFTVLTHPKNISIFKMIDTFDVENQTLTVNFVNIFVNVKIEIEEDVLVFFNSRYVIEINLV